MASSDAGATGDFDDRTIKAIKRKPVFEFSIGEWRSLLNLKKNNKNWIKTIQQKQAHQHNTFKLNVHY